MTNISKPFAASATASLDGKFNLATLKLTFFYVLSTALILVATSVAVLIIFTPPAADVPFQPETEEVEVEYDKWGVYELREHLATVIAFVDVLMLLVVSVLSYYFARRTLLPIKHIYELQHQFMSDVAHELRTPLSVMQAGADTMLRKQRSLEEYEVFVKDTQEEIGRLTRLSNQLLQLLRTDRVQSVAWVDTDLSNLIKTEVQRFIPYADTKIVTLACVVPENITLDTDRDRLIEVLQNLLKNAIDYNKQGGRVTATLSETAAHVAIAIEDTGVGIAEVKQAKVFDRFVKGEKARTQTTESGAGLGLSIVKALVAKLGGTITLESIEAVGTTVTLLLPKTHS